jgi:hypothetical protein
MTSPALKAVFIVRLMVPLKIFMNLDGVCIFASRQGDGVFKGVFSGCWSVAGFQLLFVYLSKIFNGLRDFVEVV